jgi:retron-type reverse transcriptase
MRSQLFITWQSFRHGKKPNPAIDAFEYGLEKNLRQLAHDIETQTYRHGGYRHVVVEEKKRRDLAVATVRDRVVHRLVYDELTAIYDRTFDVDVWSCRKGKGLHKCLARTRRLLAKHRTAFIWRTDISKFFDHVNHEVMKKCLRRRISNLQTLRLCDEIINSYSCQRGGGSSRLQKKSMESQSAI